MMIKTGLTETFALAAAPPQNNVGAAPYTKEFHRTVAAGVSAPISGWLKVRAIHVTMAGEDDLASNSVQLVVAPVTVRGSPHRRRPSSEAAHYVERRALHMMTILDTTRAMAAFQLAESISLGVQMNLGLD